MEDLKEGVDEFCKETALNKMNLDDYCDSFFMKVEPQQESMTKS